MTQPICKVGDRTDFLLYDFPNREDINRVGEVIEVIDGQGFEHQYVIKCGNDQYRVHESRVSTPFGDDDD